MYQRDTGFRGLGLSHPFLDDGLLILNHFVFPEPQFLPLWSRDPIPALGFPTWSQSVGETLHTTFSPLSPFSEPQSLLFPAESRVAASEGSLG